MVDDAPGRTTRTSGTTRLRATLTEVLRTELGAVEVLRLCPQCASPEHGQPVVRLAEESAEGPVEGPAPWVSLAYADGLGAVAWSRSGPVGIDVEAAGPPVDGVGDRLAWTRHEALAKATGLGLAAADPPDLPTYSLDLPTGYVGTVAGDDVEWRVTRA